MNENHITEQKLSRRSFLQVGAGAAGGLMVSTVLPLLRGRAATGTPQPTITPWLHIASDDSVTVMIPSAEMGQGITTSLPMLIAEELEVDWRKVRFEAAPADPAYANPIFHMQATGGSTSIRAFYTPLREVGAAARMMLCQAAAEKWGVPLSECNAANGRISHPSGKSESYGALADAASKLPIPTNLQLKARSNWRILGKPTARLDTPLKVDGSAQFGIDVRVPDMLVGTIAASPVFGGKLKSVDDTPALRVKGVRAVVKLGDAVAVLGEGYWPCKKGLEALSPQWEEGSNANLDSARIATMLNDGFGEEGAVAEIQGDPAAALQKATKTVEAIYPGLRVCRELPTCERPLGRPDDKTGAVAVLYSGQCLGLATHHRAAEGQAALSQGVHFGWPG